MAPRHKTRISVPPMHAPEGEEMMAESKRSRTDDRAKANGRRARAGARGRH